MIILISPEQTGMTEINTLHQLFEEGLTHYHLRKPTASLQEHIDYLNAVDAGYHKHIITHNHRKELCSRFNLKGVHLEEAQWRAQGAQLQSYVTSFKNTYAQPLSVSSSYHEQQDLTTQKVHFDYTILSPVFTAISKSGMQGRGFDVRAIDTCIIGMGGINAQTVGQALALGFKGVGALGGVWGAEDPVEAFREIKYALEKA